MNNLQSFDLFSTTPAPWTFDIKLHSQIQYLLDQYCFCPSTIKSWEEVSLDKSTEVWDLVTKFPKRTIAQRKKNKLLKQRNTQKGLECLKSLIMNYQDNGEIVVHRSRKSRNFSKPFKSGRRSSYIGVSRNGDVWQSLIMIDGKKTYIGSYHTEQEAARSYDFYSLILKQFSAKTNFDYSITQIWQMIVDYHDNNNEFVSNN